ncbi:uncharacterized protein LOC112694349 [Sipha flava]|uniref:Uncharacterized protein LOC112694349 n=1 Tax=Sipha flava TaxID=143950 RepID=A0A8B8GR46_9HEMI|nr:uncharacterized protein LOC112694349 [Sipha flava]
MNNNGAATFGPQEPFVTLSQVRDMSDRDMLSNPVTRLVLRRAWQMVHTILDHDPQQPAVAVQQRLTAQMAASALVPEPRRTCHHVPCRCGSAHGAQQGNAHRPAPYPPAPPVSGVAEPRRTCHHHVPCRCGPAPVQQGNVDPPPPYPGPSNRAMPRPMTTHRAPAVPEVNRTWHVPLEAYASSAVQNNVHRPSGTATPRHVTSQRSPEVLQPRSTWHVPCETYAPRVAQGNEHQPPYPGPSDTATPRHAATPQRVLEIPQPRSTWHVPQP